jgi:hypothetical protein
MNYGLILDVAAAFLLLGLFLAGAYEALAIINNYVPFTGHIPYITDIVRPWIAGHPGWSLLIATIIFADLFWLFGHFYLTK